MFKLRDFRQQVLESDLRDLDLLETLKASDPTDKWISDFVHSDNPKFADKSKKERIRMALGAKYAAMRKENTEHTNELKTDTLRSYAKAANKTIWPLMSKPGTSAEQEANMKKANKREAGITAALKKITKKS